MSIGGSGQRQSAQDEILAEYAAGHDVRTIARDHQVSGDDVYNIVSMLVGPEAGSGDTPNPPPRVSVPVAAGTPLQTFMSRIVLIAGLMAVVGSLLPWTITSSAAMGTLTTTGIEGPAGWGTAGLGLVLVLYGCMRRLTAGVPVIGSVLAGVCSGALAGLSLWQLVDLKADLAQTKATLMDQAVAGSLLSPTVHVNIGNGLWMCLTAAVVGVAAMVVILTSRQAGR